MFHHDGEWICHCGTKRKKGEGWSNLLSHINADHEDELEEIQKAMDEYIKKLPQLKKELF